MTKKNNSTDVPLKIQILREKMRAFSANEVQHLIHQVVSQEATIHMCYPFGDLIGPIEYFDMVYQPLLKSIPDLERREMICVTGITEKQQTWLGTMGNYMGTFLSPFLEIPPNGHLVHMRFHEFFCIEDGKIIEVQGYYSLHEATDTHYDYWCSILRGLGYELRIEDDRISTTHVPLGGEHVRDDLFSDPGGVKNYIDKITADAVRLINYFGGELNASR